MGHKPDWMKAQQERVLKTTENDGIVVEEPDGFSRRRHHSGGQYRKSN